MPLGKGKVGFDTASDDEPRNARASSKIPVSAPSQKSFQTWVQETSNVDTSDPIQLAKGIFFQGLHRVSPSKLILSHLKVKGSVLKLENEEKTTIDLCKYKKKYVVGFGKACLPMAETVTLILHNHIHRCVISVSSGSRKCKNSVIEVHCGARDNIPDEHSFKAAKAIVELAQSCTKDDLLIVLISGGGSALFPYPVPPITLNEKKKLLDSLSNAGCTVHELNTVHKRISLVKGGGLVQLCKAGRILTLIINAVAGSPMDIISQGPTVENYDDSYTAMEVIERYDLKDTLSESIQQVLSKPPPTRPRRSFDHVTNFIIGDNRIAIEAVASAAQKYGLRPFIVTANMFGEAADVGYNMANLIDAFAFCLNHRHPNNPDYNYAEDPEVKWNVEAIRGVFQKNEWSLEGILPDIYDEIETFKTGICLLFGGETSVKIKGCGEGGRNQELVLSAGIRLDLSRNSPTVRGNVAILSGGTDGSSGPNTATGAVIGSATIHNSQINNLSPMTYLKENNAYSFFQKAEQGKCHIISGNTETNFMDLVVIVILKKSRKDSKQK